MRRDKGKAARDYLKLFFSVMFCWLYIPAFVAYSMSRGKTLIKSDLCRAINHITIKLPSGLSLLFFLHNDRYFRNLFYYRIGPVSSFLISWIRPGDRYFILSKTMKTGKEFGFLHPYATVINAESVGDHFTCLHGTTVGSKGSDNKPIIGNYVTLGASVTIIGKITIGNNVKIGAGSVVVKDVPDNCVVAGNPAKIIKYLEQW